MRTAGRLAGALLIFAASSVTAQTLQPATVVGASDEPGIDVFAGGNIKDVLGQPDATVSASGNLGLRYRGRVYVVNALVNIAGTRDTITRGHGASLLQPAAGTALNAGLLDVRTPRFQLIRGCVGNEHRIPCHFGLHAYISASTGLWARTDPVDTNSIVRTYEVPSWGSGLDVSYTFANGFMGADRKPVAMILDVGWATRHIRGELGMDDAARDSVILTRERNFSGIEVGLTVQYDLITAGITYYYFGGRVSGFSRGQIVAGASIQSNLNSGTYSSH